MTQLLCWSNWLSCARSTSPGLTRLVSGYKMTIPGGPSKIALRFYVWMPEKIRCVLLYIQDSGRLEMLVELS